MADRKGIFGKLFSRIESLNDPFGIGEEARRQGEELDKKISEAEKLRQKRFLESQKYIDLENERLEQLKSAYAKTDFQSLGQELEYLLEESEEGAGTLGKLPKLTREYAQDVLGQINDLENFVEKDIEKLTKATSPEQAATLGSDVQMFQKEIGKIYKNIVKGIQDLQDEIRVDAFDVDPFGADRSKVEALKKSAEQAGMFSKEEGLDPEGITGKLAAAFNIEGLESAAEKMRQAIADDEKTNQLLIERLNIVKSLQKELDKMISDQEKFNSKITAGNKSFAEAAQSFQEGFSGVAQSVNKTLSKFTIFGTDLRVILAGLLTKEFVTITNQTQELAKQMGSTRDFAEELRDSMTGFGVSLSNSLVTQKSVLEATLALNKQLGTAIINQQDLVQGQIDLVKGFQLQAEEATGIAKLAIQNRNTTKETTKEILNQVSSLARQTGILLDTRSVLKEISGLSANIRAQLGFSTENIAEAVVAARSFGTTLSTVEKAAAGLLNFQDSISAELEAQLITGRAINLNQARSFALNGDLAGVVTEIANQMGSMAEFGKLNVIQQRSLAKAFGLSAAELSSMVEERFILNELGAENIDQLKEEGRLEELLLVQGGERLYQQQLQQSQAQRFQEAMDRLSSTLVDIVEGPLGLMIEGFAGLLNSAAGFGAVMGILTGGAVLTGISSLIGAATTLAGILATSATSVLVMTGGLAALGAIAGVGAYNYSKTGSVFGNLFSSEEDEEMPGSGIMNTPATPVVQDAYIESDQGPFMISSAKYGELSPVAITTEGDNLMASPNLGAVSADLATPINQAASRSLTSQTNNSVSNNSMSSTISELNDPMSSTSNVLNKSMSSTSNVLKSIKNLFKSGGDLTSATNSDIQNYYEDTEGSISNIAGSPYNISKNVYNQMMNRKMQVTNNETAAPNIQASAPATLSAPVAAMNTTSIAADTRAPQLERRLDEMISSNKAVIAAIDKNTQVSQQNAQFLAKAKQKLVVGATDLGTDLNVHSYRIQFGAWAIMLLQSGLGFL